MESGLDSVRDGGEPCGKGPTLALLVSYNGEPFCGFARQEGLPTVQGELERALATVFRHPVDTVCAGRTDSGVHARGQVVSVPLEPGDLDGRSLFALTRSLNALTDDAIAVRRIGRAADGFSARFDAQWREYRYRICTGPVQPVFSQAFAWWIASADGLDLEAMRAGAANLVGEHDFKSFCVAASAEGKTTNRCVMRLEVSEDELLGEPGIVVTVVGNAFLHSMVRTIVGTLVDVGCGRRGPDWVAEVLEARDRRAAGQTAPAAGLVFWHVEYPEGAIRWETGR